MVAIAEPRLLISPAEYLSAERQAAARHEYVRGQVYPMPGVSATHDRLFVNLMVDLGSFLDDHPCEVRGSDLKLRLREGQIFYYPDLMVCCDPTDRADYWRERPRFVVEITSPETQRTDSIEKAAAYFETPSIESYVQVSQTALA
ncbi:MAG: Uma2 family endonuclease, partial [Fimbriimonadaceae bacterium]|nr:Uma2 family endonuclease [Fimbriimonadaceae bacterium]